MKYTWLACLLSLSSSLCLAQASVSLISQVQNADKQNLVADSFGRTLYVFDLDQGAAAPKCAGDCTEVWPPYVLTATEAAGLKAPLGSIVRANKKLQLTYANRPVYTYAFDRQHGDDQGDGVGGVWHDIVLK